MNLLAALILAQVAAAAEYVTPELAFPEPGVEDSAAYEGYRTRFVRDAADNAVQIYINQADGRVVHLWADAANASAAFTVRDERGHPATLAWGSDSSRIGRSGAQRSVEYRLVAGPAPLEIGAFLLGSMRLERDFQYQRGHLEPFGRATIEQPELLELIGHLERLDAAERRRQLELLGAASTVELRDRLRPAIRLVEAGGRQRAVVEHRTFDGRNRMSLELTVEDGRASLDEASGTVRVEAGGERPVHLTVTIVTDNGTLGPLGPDQIFNAGFLAYRDRIRDEAGSDTGTVAATSGDRDADTAVASGGWSIGVAAAATGAQPADGRYRRLDRQVRSLRLVSYEEKLMAGLPNYATYFGRDMIMSALMMESIWTPDMIEHVIASVLRKLAPTGAVSHEEALGGQAIRENAVAYNGVMASYFAAAEAGRAAAADSLLADARAVLGQLQRINENYHMVDDDFQFPVLAGRYLGNPDVPNDRKREFLLAEADGGEGTRLERLLRNLAFVVRAADRYAREPVASNLIGFQRRPDGRWYASSWRDSGAGYGNGRYAMDVNAIWVPEALAAVERILAGLAAAGFPAHELAERHRDPQLALLWDYAGDRARLRAALETWRGVRERFVVELGPGEARRRVDAWIASLPDHEGAYWRGVVDATGIGGNGIRFLALSLDSAGRPIPVANTDPAMLLFLEDMTGRVLAGEYTSDQVLAEVEPFLLPYPLGLFVPEVGPLVANDAYASPAVWQGFRDDLYHSPRVVWGREVNLLILGLTRQISAAYDDAGRLRDPGLEEYAARLTDALERTVAAVEASGLKDNELWTYRIEDGRLYPLRYATSTDIQLWNLTDLAVQFELSRLPGAARAAGAGAPAGR